VTRPLLLDGGTGSELRRRSVRVNEQAWSAAANLDHTDTLVAIHRDYIAAGADIITANTFATSRFVLDAAGLADRFDAINRNAIDAARRAAAESGREVSIAASLSCCPPRLDTSAWPSPAVELDGYRELANLFATGGVDLILLEMLQHAAHAERACRAARESGLPFWAGISVNEDLVSFDAPSEPLADVVAAILPFAPAGIAIMHSPPGAIAPALHALRRDWHGATGAYAEIPYAEDPANTSAARMTPDGYAAAADNWRAPDLRLLGGCCGTTPAHIAALRRLLDADS